MGEMPMNTATLKIIVAVLGLAASLAGSSGASAQDVQHYRFAHDQQIPSGYSVAYEIFSAKLKALSNGCLLYTSVAGAAAELGDVPPTLRSLLIPT